MEDLSVVPEKERKYWIYESLKSKKMLPVFGKYFFPNIIKGFYEVPDCHLDLCDEISRRQNSAIIFPRGFAKAQSLDSNILTPKGFIKLKDLSEGDRIIGADGKFKKVLKLHPIEKMELYKVITRDGRSTLCNLDHLWNVQIPSNTKNRIVTKTLREIKKNYKNDRFDKRDGRKQTEYRYFVPTVKPIEFTEKRLPIDPYTLGAWLGDGTSECGAFTTEDIEIVSFFPYKTSKQKAKLRWTIWGICKELRKLNLLKNKHIPEKYLFASIKQREALLQGLIDTDGYIVKGGHIVGFCNKNKQIMDGFVHLVRSLGGTCNVKKQRTRFDKFSKYKTSFIATARFPNGIVPTRLSRKRNLWKGSFRTRAAIIDIKFEKEGLGRCITVEGNLYLTDDFLLTHNSTWEKIDTIHDIVYAHEPVILYISASLREAAFHFESIKAELESNELIRYIYGNLVPLEIDEKQQERIKRHYQKWTNTHFETRNKVNVVARGAGKGRGVNIKNQRPTKIIIDDAENDDQVNSNFRREKFHNWLYNVIIPSMDKDRGFIKMIGTIIHSDCEVLKFYKAYGGIFRRAIEDGQSIWQEGFTLEKLFAIRDGWTDKDGNFKQGIGSRAFNQEYMNNPIDETSQIIKQDWITRNFYDIQPPVKDLDIIMACDPAIGQKEMADFLGITVVGKQNSTGFIYVLAVYKEKLSIDKQVEKIIEIYNIWKPRIIGIETVMTQRALSQLLAAKKAEGIYLPILEITPQGKDKVMRSRAIEPFIENNTIKFNRYHEILHYEMITFPNGAHDDVFDSFIYAVDLAMNTKPLSYSVGKKESGVAGDLMSMQF